MIIDVHAHMGESGFVPQTYLEGAAGRLRERRIREGKSVEEAERAANDKLAGFPDPTGEKLIQTMDAAGIDKSVILPVDRGLIFGESTVSIEEQNKQHSELSQKYPNRIIAFAGVDPRRKDSLQLFGKAVKEWGAKGLKLHPLSGFYLNDASAYPLYDKAQELGVPVLVHLGTDPPPWRNKYGQPIYLDDVAIDFPELQIIGAHMGGIWENEAVQLASIHPNLYLDLSTKHRQLDKYPLEFYQGLRRVLDRLGPGKLMFGSDYPYLGYSQTEDQIRWVKAFTEVPGWVGGAGLQFTDEEINGILGDNAARVVGVE